MREPQLTDALYHDASAIVSDSAPGDAEPGRLWIDSGTGKIYRNLGVPSHTVWVEVGDGLGALDPRVDRKVAVLELAAPSCDLAVRDAVRSADGKLGGRPPGAWTNTGDPIICEIYAKHPDTPVSDTLRAILLEFGNPKTPEERKALGLPTTDRAIRDRINQRHKFCSGSKPVYFHDRRRK